MTDLRLRVYEQCEYIIPDWAICTRAYRAWKYTEGRFAVFPDSPDFPDVPGFPEIPGIKTPWQCLKLLDALAFRGRSPSVTKRATHPSVHRVKSTKLKRSVGIPRGGGLRSSISLAPSCATDQDLAS